MDQPIDRCRICGATGLVPVLDLGRQALTGIFPAAPGQPVPTLPLVLVKCVDEGDPGRCGLLQLLHSGDPGTMYGSHYGYRSGLNRAMVAHLQDKVRAILARVDLAKGDLVLDLGSNDGTTLAAYPRGMADLAGFDPAGASFARHYREDIRLIPDFFSADAVRAAFGRRRAKIITSLAMFYDLESPMDFMRQIHECLADDGIWVLEQSYMPAMLEMNAYDTVCHEHLEYYALRPIRWMMDRVGFRILEVGFNAVNGGSFSVTAAKATAPYPCVAGQVDEILRREDEAGLGRLEPYEEFRDRVVLHRDAMRAFLRDARGAGRTVLGYGASTKGNVLLQYCGVTANEIPCIAEVNEDKFGRYTPGTLIPIVSEEEARRLEPSDFLVLPWHFRDAILERERTFLRAGGRLVFPLPRIETVGPA